MVQRWRLGVALAVVAAMAVGVVLVWRTSARPPMPPAQAVVQATAVEEPAPGPTQIETSLSPTASAAASVVTRPNEPPPPLENTGEDFDRIWRSIEAYRDWLYAHPDPDLLDNIYDPECHCWEDEHFLLSDYAATGDWWVGGVATVRSVEVRERPDPETVTLRVVNDHSPGHVTNSSGAVLQEEQGALGETYDIVLRRSATGQWRTLALVLVE